MESLGALLGAVIPLALVGAVSPVIFLNASGYQAREGRRGVVHFMLGNVLVLVGLGFAAMGLLGAGTVSAAEREIASRAVDRVLGLLLLCYALHLFLVARRRDDHPSTDDTPAASGALTRGVVAMATNFTTLPVFMSASQRIGAATEPLLVKALVLALAIAIIATPAWLPLLLARLSPHRAGVSEHTRARISDLTQVISIGGCLFGALFLLLHGL